MFSQRDTRLDADKWIILFSADFTGVGPTAVVAVGFVCSGGNGCNAGGDVCSAGCSARPGDGEIAVKSVPALLLPQE